MIKILISIFLLAPSLAIADGVPKLPGAGSFVEPKYKAAADKAGEAFLIQAGFAQQWDAFTGAVSREANHTAAKFIDNNTPLKSKTVFFVLGTGYAIGVKKQVTKSFSSPLFNNVTHTVSAGKNSGSFTLQVPF